jgi:sugar lactone lactonase YvrE
MERQCVSCLSRPHFFLLSAFCCCAGACAGTVERVGANLALVEPFGIAFDSAGNFYICEYKGERITRLGTDGVASRFAGTGAGSYGGDGGRADAAGLNDPHGVLIGPGDRMYIADTLNNRIREVDLKTKVISTIAGSGEKGFSGDGGPATQAKFDGAFGIALTSAGDKLYVADLGNRRIRAIDLKSGIITTVAGNGKDGIPSDDAIANESPLQDPRAVTVDSKGRVYILERRGNALRIVGVDGRIRTLIKPGSVSPDLNGPKHLCVDRNDNVIIADSENHLIRKYSPRDGSFVIIAGTGKSGARLEIGNPLGTQLNRPHGVIVGPTGDLYVSDSYNNRLLRIKP